MIPAVQRTAKIARLREGNAMTRPAKKARERLRGHWGQAILVQCLVIGSSLALLLTELLCLRLFGIRAEEAIHLDELRIQPKLWLHIGIIAAMIVIDLLLVSPLHLGQAAFYDALAAGRPASVRQLWRGYRAGRYGRAVRLRLSLWMIRLLSGAVCFLPSAVVFAYSDHLRQTGLTTPFVDVCRIFCLVFGLFALLAGWILWEMWMLRFQPAVYLVAEGLGVCRALGASRRIMRRRIGGFAWFHLGFAGWLAACLLVLPYFYAAPLFMTAKTVVIRRYRRACPESAREKKPKKSRRKRAASPFDTKVLPELT